MYMYMYMYMYMHGLTIVCIYMKKLSTIAAATDWVAYRREFVWKKRYSDSTLGTMYIPPALIIALKLHNACMAKKGLFAGNVEARWFSRQ